MSTPPYNENGYNPNSTDSKITELLSELKGMREDFRDYRKDSEKRLHALEIEAATGRGKTVVLSAIASVGLSSLVGWLIDKK